MPKISIIVPVYNVEKYLNRCVDSILNQTFNDFELILVDDGSPDNCGKICDEYEKKDKRVKVIHKENGGVSDARNVGIEAAKGEYLGFVDGDDFIHPQMYEILYKGIKENNVYISVCGYEESKELCFSEQTIEPIFSVLKKMDFLFLENEMIVDSSCNKLYLKSLFNEMKYPVGKIHEEAFVIYKMLYKVEKIAYCEKILYKYFVNENSQTRLEATLVKSRNEEELQKRTDYFSKKTINSLESTREKMEFLKNNGEEKYIILYKRYIFELEAVFCLFYNGKKSYLKDDGSVIKLMKEIYNDVISLGNKYEKMYFFMIKHGILLKWIAKNDFEPIQNILRKIKYK